MNLDRVKAWARRLSGFDDLGAKIDGHLRRLAHIDDRLDDCYRAIVSPEKPKPSAFVMVLARGWTEPAPPLGALGVPLDRPFSRKRRAVWLGQSKRLGGDRRHLADTVELQTVIPLRNVEVLVLADLERVIVRNITYGVQVVSAGYGPCPIGRFPSWEVSIPLCVQCEVVS